MGWTCLLLPGVGLQVLGLPAAERPGICRVGGIVSLVVAAVIFIALFPGGI